MFFTENGPECNDEVNLGVAGGDYGWPRSHSGPVCVYPTDNTNDVEPLFVFPTTVGITGIDVYEGPIAAWQGSLFWCAVNTGQIYRAALDDARTGIAGVNLVDGAPACSVDVQRGPDGALYVTANNTISRIRPFFPTDFVFLPLV